MASEDLVQSTGTEITHDETAGLQNSVATPAPATDADDDDVLVSTLPSPFSTRLTALGSNPTGAIGAAESPGNVVTFSPTGTLGNIALTDANGAPLDGDDSGLVTTGGDAILLYSDTNDNIVLGKTAGGTIVFAIYLEETGGSPPIGAKLWTVQYQAIDHGDDGNNHDSAVNLTDLVYVTANEEQSFSFSSAPSGQNLFMAFGNASQAIIVTGEDPANQSAGQNVSNDGDTVNTGQGGGDTTIGTEGQQIKAQKALVVTFVSGADPGLLVPNLSPGEAGVESNIDFTGYVLAQAAEITISQMTPGGPSTTATVELAAYVTADAADIAYIDNNPLVTGDTPINITDDSVQVIRGGVNVVGTLGVTVNYAGSTAVISGVKDDDIIRYSTDADHNRVLIRNDQPASGQGSNVSFDLGGFTLTEVAGDTDEVGSKIFFEDDGPAIDLTPTTAGIAVDESVGTAGSNKDEPGNAAPDDETAAGAPVGAIGYAVTSAATLFSETADAGSDGQASKVYALVLNAGATGLTDTATDQAVVLSLVGGAVEGRTATSGDLVFTIAVDSTTGAVTTTQFRALDHGADANDHDSAVSMASGLVELTATLTDGDTDFDADTIELGSRIGFEDDGPAIDLTPTTAGIAVDESVGTAGSSKDEPGNAAPDDETAAGAPAGAIGYAVTSAATLFSETADAGSDGQASKVYALVLNAGATGLTDTATDQAVVLSLVNGAVEGRTATSGALVFTIAVDSTTGAVTTTQFRALDHGADANDHDSAVSMASGLVELTATLTDGDTDTGSDKIELGSRIGFEDDGPTVTVNNATGTYAAGAAGTWDHDPGTDGFQSLDVTFDGYEIDSHGSVLVGAALTKTGDFAFEGSITDDFNNDGTDETVDFTLIFDPVADTYDLEVTTPPSTIVKFDTSQGNLPPGGPEEVQTLFFGGPGGGNDIVFFGVVATAPQQGIASPPVNDIQDLVVVGATDLTELQIDALLPLPGLITPGTEMNVSTSGIGVNNNNLNGANEGAGTGPLFAGTTITSGDESFVVNPETVVDNVRVFIDNSVGGYNAATEDLYYTVYYTDGTVSGPTDVTAPTAVPALDPNNEFPDSLQGHGQYFDIDGGDKQIDAVQLTMGRGTIKIPVIQFSVEQAFEPEPVQLDFTATLVDGDGDTQQDSFSVDLLL